MNDRIEKLKTFLLQSPADCFLNHALALEYIKAGDEAAALQHFTANLHSDPSYVATYYHLAKLYERAGNTALAISTYEAGIVQAKAAKDMHSCSELQSALEDLIY